MRVLLTAQEVSRIVAKADYVPGSNKMLLEIPDDRILQEGSPLDLSEPGTVRCGEQSAELTKTQFSLLRYLTKRGKATYGELRKFVFDKSISDQAICLAGTALFDVLAKAGVLRAARQIIDVNAADNLVELVAAY